MQEDNAYKAPQTTGQLEKKPNAKNPTFVTRLIEVSVVVAVVGILLAMLLPSVRVTPEAGHRTVCLNHIKQLSLAMLNYEIANGHLPPAYIADENGKPMHSWRVLILPYIDEQDLYKRYSFDEPWDGPSNSKLHDEIVDVYRCPNDLDFGNPVNGCSYAVVTGKGTAFDGDQETDCTEVTDGTSNTLLLVELRNPATHWMEPVDLTMTEALSRLTDASKKTLCCNHSGTINVSLMDGSTHAIEFPISRENLKALVTIDGGEIVDVTDL